MKTGNTRLSRMMRRSLRSLSGVASTEGRPAAFEPLEPRVLLSGVTEQVVAPMPADSTVVVAEADPAASLVDGVLRLDESMPRLEASTIDITGDVVVEGGVSASLVATSGAVRVGALDGVAAATDEDLTVTAQGAITLEGAVGAAEPIRHLTINSETGEAVRIAGSVTIEGDLRITRAGSVTIVGDVTIGGNLVIDEATDIVFTGAVRVTGSIQIADATTAAFNGAVVTNGGSIATSGTQTFRRPVVTGAELHLAADAFTLSGAIDSAAAGEGSLFIDVQQNVMLYTPMGGTQPLQAVTVHGGGGIIMAASINAEAGGISISGETVTLLGQLRTTDGGDINLTARGASLVLANRAGIDSDGDTTLTSPQLLAIGQGAQITSGGELSLGDADALAIKDGAIISVLNGNNLVITSDKVGIGRAQLTGQGAVVLQPTSGDAAITLGSDAEGFAIDADELAALGSGFGSLIIGRGRDAAHDSGEHGQHDVRITGATLPYGLTVRAAGPAGRISVDGDVNITGDNRGLSLVAGSELLIDSGTLTAAGNLTLDADGQVTTNRATLRSLAGDVTINGNGRGRFNNIGSRILEDSSTNQILLGLDQSSVSSFWTPGQRNFVSLSLANTTADMISGDYELRMYASADQTLSGDDVIVGTQQGRLVVPGSQERRIAGSYTVPAELAVGDYFLVAEIIVNDWSHSFGDAAADFSEKVAVAANATQMRAADLAVAGVNTTFDGGSWLPGQRGLVNVTVANQSPDTLANGWVDVDIYASASGTLDGAVLIGTMTDQRLVLSAGQQTTMRGWIDLPSEFADAFTSGSYKLVAHVNADGSLSETDDSNNVGSGDASFFVQSPFVDLGVSDLAVYAPGQYLVAGDRLTINVTLTNHGNVAMQTSGATISVLASAVGQDAANAVEVSAQGAPNFTLQPGQSRVVRLNVTVPEGFEQGDYQFAVQIDGIAGEAGDNDHFANTAATVESYDISSRFGTFGDRRNVPLTFDDNGVSVTLILAGDGFGQVSDTTAGAGFDLVLTNTTSRSSLLVRSTGGNATLNNVVVGSEAASADLRSFSAAAANLQGNMLFHGTVSFVDLADVTGQSSVTVLGSKGPVSFRLGSVSDLSIDSAMPVQSLTATQWLNTDAQADQIAAPSIDRLTITGDGRLGAAGDFQASLNLSDSRPRLTLGSAVIAGTLGSADATEPTAFNVDGNVGVIAAGVIAEWDANVTGEIGRIISRGDTSQIDLTALSVGAMTVRGDLADSAITLTKPQSPNSLALRALNIRGIIDNLSLRAQADVGMVTTDALLNSDILAGVDEAGENPTQQGEIGRIVVRRRGGLAAASFVNTRITAWSIGAAHLGTVGQGQGEQFGLRAGVIGSMVASSQQGNSVVLRQLNQPSDFTQFNPLAMQLPAAFTLDSLA